MPPGLLGLPADEQYARNLIGGRWTFPAFPFDYEVRSPLDGTVTTTVPLSSRLDVARAVTAAVTAAASWAADQARRAESLARLTAEIGRQAESLARLQALETGLAPEDSRAAIWATQRWCGNLVRSEPDITPRPAPGHPVAAGGASGHVLSWGLPFTEVACAVLPHLQAGRTAVIRPSLRAPLSAAAFAHLVTSLDFPPGVVNLVQGTGVDAGAALVSAPGLAALHVRAGERTLRQAARSAMVTGTPLSRLRAGGNVALVGRDAAPIPVAEAVTSALRLHSAGGPWGLPLLCVHESAADALLDAVLRMLDACRPAPLPAEPLRDRALAQIAALRRAGTVLRGGAVPDDARHRMGWLLPPTVIMAGAMHGEGGRMASGPAEPTGPVLTVVTWRSATEIAGAFRHPRYADGMACAWGLDAAEVDAAGLPHAVLLRESAPATALAAGTLPSAWTGGIRVPSHWEATALNLGEE
jgi:acyl-CoA reductase-like NAD-dependent aldehyde dehydrogenase